MRRPALVLLAATLVAAAVAPSTARAQRGGPRRTEPFDLPPAYALHVGRYPVSAADAAPRPPAPPAGAPDGAALLAAYLPRAAADPTLWARENLLEAAGVALADGAAGQLQWQGLAWTVRFGADGAKAGPGRAELFRTLGDLHARAGEDDLSWWAWQRAIEEGHPAAEVLTARTTALETRWKAAGRADPPAPDQYRFARAGAARWMVAFHKAERQALGDGENPADAKVWRRLVGEADMEVPPVFLGADTFMRRWGVGLMVAGVAAVFWTLFLFAALRRRRRRAAPGATA